MLIFFIGKDGVGISGICRNICVNLQSAKCNVAIGGPLLLNKC